MKNTLPTRIKTISELHRLRGFAPPTHPLFSVVEQYSLNQEFLDVAKSIVFDFYCITLKRNSNIKIRYGQQHYDFDEGIMYFMSPGQVFGLKQESIDEANKVTGWIILIHPDFLWNTRLAKNIKDYMFFDYSVNEALFLSEKEECIILEMIRNLQKESTLNIDEYSQKIMIAQLETLLNYGQRFYNRQFITRKKANHQILENLESVLTNAFSRAMLSQHGMPTVENICEKLNLSRNYLSSLLRFTTGRNTQQHIHDKAIEVAKERLSLTNMTVSEIAYELGFDHPQSFSRMFRVQTGMTPLKFRESLN